MKKFLCIILAALSITAVFASCSQGSNQKEQIIVSSTAPSTTTASEVETSEALSPTTLSETTTKKKNTNKTADYACNFESDKKSFNPKKIDIKVGDNYYMTQINDWYKNFKDYSGKSVEIEGLFEQFGDYYYVARNGPSCPYCTGGMVTFEIHSDYDYSKLSVGKTWIKVDGVLKKGTDVDDKGKSYDFYYIEAFVITAMPETGISTVTN